MNCNKFQDLPKNGGSGQAASSTAVGTSKEAEDESKTIYKMIDPEKTEAFKKTKEDRENQRHANDT